MHKYDYLKAPSSTQLLHQIPHILVCNKPKFCFDYLIRQNIQDLILLFFLLQKVNILKYLIRDWYILAIFDLLKKYIF